MTFKEASYSFFSTMTDSYIFLNSYFHFQPRKSVMKSRLNQKRRSRRAVSEIMGAILMLGVTMAIGFGVWAWASGAAVGAERNFGNSINSNIACLNENFIIPNANFSSSSNNLVTVWFYNTGNGTVNLSNVLVTNSTWTFLAYFTSSNQSLPSGGIHSYLLNVHTSFTKGAMYTFKGVAKCQGSITANYQQVR